MRVEERRLSVRLIRPALVIVAVLAVLVLPTWLWMTRGRKVPLQVVLDPEAYVVVVDQTLALRPRVTPADDTHWTWTTAGHCRVPRGREGIWRAPANPGRCTVTLKVRRSGTTVEDSVTLQVSDRKVSSLPITRPPAPTSPPDGLPPCKGSRPPSVVVHGDACVGGNLVLEVRGEAGARIWHWWDGERDLALEGRWVDMRLSGETANPKVATRVVPPGARCAWTIHTPVKRGGCRAGPGSGAVFANFGWQMVGPGHFRFAAKPSRTPGQPFSRYRWDFGDGIRKEGKDPRISHRFKGSPKRWHLVRLEVQAEGGRASTCRAVMDRSVKEPASTPAR